jgi:hypothetical protein
LSSNEAFHADRGFSIPAVRQSTIDHVDTPDSAVSASQVERARTLAALEDVADSDVVGLTASVDDLEVEHLNVAAARKETYRREASLSATDTYGIAVRLETDLLTSELNPVTVTPTAIVITISPLRTRITRERASQCQRARQYGRRPFQIHHHLPDPGNDPLSFPPLSRREDGEDLLDFQQRR